MKRIESGEPTNADGVEDDAGQEEEGRGRSARKRTATAAQALGMRLLELNDADLVKLPLSEVLLEALRAAHRIRGRGGLARQHQYIGRLMRDVDPAPLVAALDGRSRAQAMEAGRFRRIEALRERLIAEGEAALVDLDEWNSLAAAERSKLTKIVQRSRRSDSTPSQRTTAARELFRALRKLIGDPGSS